MLLYFLIFSLQLSYLILLIYFISKSFEIAIKTKNVQNAHVFLTSGIILVLSLLATISLLKTLYFQSWEQLALCFCLIAMRIFIKRSMEIIQKNRKF